MSDRNADGTYAEGHKSNGGRKPKQYSITAMLRSKGEAIVDPVTGQTRADRLAEQLWGIAEGGDKSIAQYIIDRLDGRPKERIEQEGETLIRIVWDDGQTDKAPPTEGVLGE